MKTTFKRIEYSELNARQKEAFNFQKVSAVLAEYGFVTIRVSSDWEGADFIAQHHDGKTFLKIQLKGRLTFDKKCRDRNLYICFPSEDEWFVYPHDDELLKKVEDKISQSESWKVHGCYHYPQIPQHFRSFLAPYRVHGNELRGLTSMPINS